MNIGNDSPIPGSPIVSRVEVSLVIPCFNEEGNLAKIIEEIRKACGGISYEVIFINDGSTDFSRQTLESMDPQEARISMLNLRKNCGKEVALRAGLRAASGKYVLTMDGDLQHPPHLIPSMLDKAREGFEVVHMIRNKPQHGLFKNLFSKSFYRLFNLLSETPITVDGSDFWLINRPVCDVLNSLPERNLVLRAIIPHLGFKSATLDFSQQDRFAGQPTYGIQKSIRLASNAIFNFSTLPLKIGFKCGLAISSLAFLYGFFNVFAKIFTDWNVPGYTDVIASVLFLGGITIMYLGIIGRYVLQIAEQLKNRPEYLVESISRPCSGLTQPVTSESRIRLAAEEQTHSLSSRPYSGPDRTK